MHLPCPDSNLPAGLSQRDIDRFGSYRETEQGCYEIELEKADRWMDERQDRKAEEQLKLNSHDN